MLGSILLKALSNLIRAVVMMTIIEKPELKNKRNLGMINSINVIENNYQPNFKSETRDMCVQIAEHFSVSLI
jgi:hypothetical protein